MVRYNSVDGARKTRQLAAFVGCGVRANGCLSAAHVVVFIASLPT